jgi:hypothetical protein
MFGTSDGQSFGSEWDYLASKYMQPKEQEQPVTEKPPEPIQSESAPGVTVDRTHEVPYVAGASNDGNTVYVDKSVPSSVNVSGKEFDPAVPLSIHEEIEHKIMQHLISQGMPDDKAYEVAHHGFAQPAEDNWYRQNGIDVDAVNKFWDGIDSKTEKEVHPDNTPPDLYTKPYPHDQVEGSGKAAAMESFKEWTPEQVQQMTHDAGIQTPAIHLPGFRFKDYVNHLADKAAESVKFFPQTMEDFSEGKRTFADPDIGYEMLSHMWSVAEIVNPSPGMRVGQRAAQVAFTLAHEAEQHGVEPAFLDQYLHPSERTTEPFVWPQHISEFPPLTAEQRAFLSENHRIPGQSEPFVSPTGETIDLNRDFAYTSGVFDKGANYSLVPSTGKNTSEGGMFDIISDTGEKVGYISVRRQGARDLYVSMIKANGVEYSQSKDNPLGSRVIKQLMRQLKQQYPDAKTISGFRISGARVNSGSGSMNSGYIPMPKLTEEQLADKAKYPEPKLSEPSIEEQVAEANRLSYENARMRSIGDDLRREMQQLYDADIISRTSR